MRIQHVALIIIMGCTTVLFQNCTSSSNYTFDASSLQSSGSDSVSIPDVPDNVEVLPDSPDYPSGPPSEPPVVDNDGSGQTSDKICQATLSGKTAIVYDSITPQQSPAKSYQIYAAGPKIQYETVDSVSNGATQSLAIEARSIASVSSFAMQELSLNAQIIGKVSNFSASLVQAVAHSVTEVSQFAGVFCASVQNIGALHNLSSKITVYGRSEGGQKASIYEIHNMAAFMSLHDVDVAAISQGSINARIENGHVGTVSHGSGVIYLVNSKIDSIDNFAGEIHLIGNSSVGSQSSSSIKIIK
ncbi:hypothetical protein [Bdellovibrio sp. HCB209]|uniref:hypothetical protein n=1 Tax=Bdellovibrio sp. HCB209 TaxID=3394354 RepID=UPI0039B6466E